MVCRCELEVRKGLNAPDKWPALTRDSGDYRPCQVRESEMIARNLVHAKQDVKLEIPSLTTDTPSLRCKGDYERTRPLANT